MGDPLRDKDVNNKKRQRAKGCGLSIVRLANGKERMTRRA